MNLRPFHEELNRRHHGAVLTSPETTEDLHSMEVREHERKAYKPQLRVRGKKFLGYLTGYESKPLTWNKRAALNNLITRIHKIRVQVTEPTLRAALCVLEGKLKARREQR